MPPDEIRDAFEIDLAPIWPEEDDRLEPIFLPGPLWIDFEDFEPTIDLSPEEADLASPLLVEFDEFMPLDVETSEDEPEEPPPAPHQRASPWSLAGSLGVHLATLLIVLIGWSSAPTEVSGTIPVQLVMEQSAAVPDEAPPGEAVAESSGEAPKAENTRPPTPAPPPPAPSAAKLAAAAPPKPIPPPQSKPAPIAKPAPAAAPKAAPETTPTPAAAPPPSPRPVPVPVPPPSPAVTQLAAAMPAPTVVQAAATVPRAAPAVAAAAMAPPAAIPVMHQAPAAAPASGHGDYLNQLVMLTRGHLDLLPASFLAGRRGRTTLSVLVLEDGTVARITVKHSSGYPDIDSRIERMVQAVGRFPPVPANFQHPAVDLDFDMTFPDALQQ